MAVDLNDIRQEYAESGLDFKDLCQDPLKQFQHWLEVAVETGVHEPNAMCLATVNANGEPSTRIVLLKYLSEKGLTFFTNYESRKAADIKTNAHVSVNFLWLPLQRQVNISGVAQRVSKAETIKYFLSRPFASQLGAWCSPQSQVISSRSVLDEAWEKMKRQYSEGQVPVPGHWGGYLIQPSRFEFWQGGAGRLHDRFSYSRDEAGQWEHHRLAP